MADFPNFFGVAPTYQNAFDLFKGEWSTRLPDACGWTASFGPGRFCEDHRLVWAAERLGGFSGKSVLELGPLEGGHSLVLEKMGVSQILALEANARAFLKCLILKEAFGLTKARFELGDFVPYLATSSQAFDAVIACGVLYHLMDPVRAIELIARHTNEVLVWTHYYDESFSTSGAPGESPFESPVIACYAGFTYTRHIRRYGKALEWKGFCGGAAVNACWLFRSDLLHAFEHFGFEILDAVEEPNPNGPVLMFVAKKKGHILSVLPPFQEEDYLSRYPDVRAAVAAGHFQSGAHHYALCGAHEGRQR